MAVARVSAVIPVLAGSKVTCAQPMPRPSYFAVTSTTPSTLRQALTVPVFRRGRSGLFDIGHNS